jgi:hypothetical protein
MEKKLTHEDYYNVARMVFFKYGNSMILGGTSTPEEMNHIIHVGASVLMTKDNFQQGGSFVQAIVDNDLLGAVNRADSTMRKCLLFMTYLRAHVSVEYELEEANNFEFETIEG